MDERFKSDAAIDRKIIDLFQARGIEKIAEHTIDDKWKRHVVLRRLMDLQRTIYMLDRYGETSWQIDACVLSALWVEILGEVHTLNLPAGAVSPQVGDLLRYQDIELGLRRDFVPTDMDAVRFYGLKTSDVRLMRATLYALSCREFSPEFQTYLDVLDIIEEVCDDMRDVDEDVCDFNCNRFILSRVLHGDMETHAVYSAMIAYLCAWMKRTGDGLGDLEQTFAHDIVSGARHVFSDLPDLLDACLSKRLVKPVLLSHLTSNSWTGPNGISNRFHPRKEDSAYSCRLSTMSESASVGS